MWYPFHGTCLEGYGSVDWLTRSHATLFMEMSKYLNQYPLKDGQSGIVKRPKTETETFDACITRDEGLLPLNTLIYMSLEHIIQNRYKYIVLRPPRFWAGIQHTEEKTNITALLSAVSRILELYPRVTIYLAVQTAPVTVRVLNDYKIPDIGTWSSDHNTFLTR